jgi:hypothetical protein
MALDPVTAALEVGGKLIDRFWPDPTTRDLAKLELLKSQQSGELAVMANSTSLAKLQTDINSIEAASTRLFVAGWRPFIGWICGIGLGYQFLIYPILIAWQPKIVQLDMGTLLTLLGGMLGFGTMRTVEKLKGKS